jgi:hypothetical protein
MSKRSKRNQQRSKGSKNLNRSVNRNQSDLINSKQNKRKVTKVYSPQKVNIDSLNIDGITSTNPFWNVTDEN